MGWQSVVRPHPSPTEEGRRLLPASPPLFVTSLSLSHGYIREMGRWKAFVFGAPSPWVRQRV
jgi:hypothetical protein